MKPWCEVCGALVEEICVYYPLEKVASCRMVVYCHGQTETCEFPVRLMLEGSMTFGKAFVGFTKEIGS